MLDYKTHISKKSMFNTPPVFAIYVSMLTLEWVKNNGGISAIEKINQVSSQMKLRTRNGFEDRRHGIKNTIRRDRGANRGE